MFHWPKCQNCCFFTFCYFFRFFLHKILAYCTFIDDQHCSCLCCLVAGRSSTQARMAGPGLDLSSATPSDSSSRRRRLSNSKTPERWATSLSHRRGKLIRNTSTFSSSCCLCVCSPSLLVLPAGLQFVHLLCCRRTLHSRDRYLVYSRWVNQRFAHEQNFSITLNV